MSIRGLPGLPPVPRWSVVMSVTPDVSARCIHGSAQWTLCVLTVAPCHYQQSPASNEISGLMTNYMFYVRGDKKFNVYQHRLQQLVLS